jgi:xylan 1,4-beta-xylosidase
MYKFIIINRLLKKSYCLLIKVFFLVQFYILTLATLNAQNVARVILPGNYPDPSIACVHGKYYIVSSSGLEIPGLPIWCSNDLQNWTKIGYGITSKVGDIWAPDLAYFNDKWYIYFTALTDHGMNNYVITSDKPEGPWSRPVKLNVRGIDPGHLVLPDGRIFLFMNGGASVELDKTGMKTIGEQKQTYKSWPIPDDYVVECNCTEGPKPFYYNGYIYLILAQGGTTGPSTGHMVVAARAKDIEGPWEFSPYNPIIRAKDKSEHWWNTGHGSLFKGTDNKWYMVFHAYENSYYTSGRQVLITQIEWTEDGWFKEATNTRLHDVEGSDFIDEFNSEVLNLNWCFFNDSSSARATVKDGTLIMNPSGKNASESKPMLFTPENNKYEVITKVTVQENATAGITLFYNNRNFWGLFLSKTGIIPMVKGAASGPINIPDLDTIYFKIRNDRNDISYFYSSDGIDWKKLERSFEISGFNANTLGGYRSIKVGLMTFGEGQAFFDSFRYSVLGN